MNQPRPRALAATLCVTLLVVGAASCSDDSNAVPQSTTDSSAPPATEAETTVPDDALVSTTPDGTTPDGTTPDGTAPDGTAPDGSSPDGSEAPGECPDEPTEGAATELLVGASEEEATSAAEACGWTLRVIRRDGEDLPATMDLRMDRVNVEITDGEVTAISSIG